MEQALKIVTGGQTGVDIAALDVAVELSILYGGWVPKGRINENGRISDAYAGLQETDTERNDVRTVLNVQASDALLVLTDGSDSGGTRLAVTEAQRLGKPFKIIDLSASSASDACEQISAFLAMHKPTALNIAGPRESEAPGIYQKARSVLYDSLRR